MPPRPEPSKHGRKQPDSVPTRLERYLAAHPNEYLRPLDLGAKLSLPTHLTAVLLARAAKRGTITKTEIPVRGWTRKMSAFGVTDDQAEAIREQWEGYE